MMRADEGVHAGDVRVHLAARVGRQMVPGAAGGAAKPDGPQETVLRECCRPENLRQPAMAAAPLELHLPQALLRMGVTESEQPIELVRRKDVRDRVRVTDDIDVAGQSLD